MGNKNLKKSRLFLGLILLLIIQSYLESIIGVFQYFDEIVALSLFIVVLYKKKRKIKGIDLYIVIMLSVLVLDGLCSSQMNSSQPVKAITGDCLLVLKFYLAYGLSRCLFYYEDLKIDARKVQRILWIVSRLLFLLTLINYVLVVWPFETRYGIMSNRLFFSHPLELASCCVVLISVNFIFLVNVKIQKWSIVLLTIVLLSTLRLTAIGAVIACLLIIFYIKKLGKRLTITKLVVVGLLAIIVAWDQISFYFFRLEGSARRQLILKSLEIARDCFPIGTGFGAYGSYMSAVFYSNVYYKYGLNTIWGLSPDKTSFTTDSYWPMVLGQFGILGVVIIISLLIILFKNIQEAYVHKKVNLYVGKMICFIYLLITSVGSSAYVNPCSIPFAIVLGII